MHGHVKVYVMRLPFRWTIFFIRFGTKLYRQVVGIPMSTSCAPVVADLFWTSDSIMVPTLRLIY